MAVSAGVVQGTVSLGINCRDVRARVRQQRHDSVVAVGARHVQRRQARPVPGVGIHRGLRQQQVDDISIADAGGDVERGRAAVIDDVGSRAVAQQQLRLGAALLEARSVQRRPGPMHRVIEH